MAYPDTTLSDDTLDPEYGGQPATTWGPNPWKWINSVVRVLSRAYLTYVRVPRKILVAHSETAAAAGDVAVAVRGLAGTYDTAQHVRAFNYTDQSAQSPVLVGVYLVACGAGDRALIVTRGSVPASAFSVGPQSPPVPAGIELAGTSAAPRVAEDGDIIFGSWDVKGNLWITETGQYLGA